MVKKTNNLKSFTNLFRDSFKDLVQNPILVIPTVSLMVFMIAFSEISIKLSSFLAGRTLIIWEICFLVIYFLAMSFFFSALILMGKDALKGKTNLRTSFSYSKKFWLKNFLIMLLILALSQLFKFGTIFGITFVGLKLGLAPSYAQILYFLAYFASLAGILIFLTFSSFYLIIYNLKVQESIKKSIAFVKKNYLYTLSILIIFFVISQVLSTYMGPLIRGFLLELINSVLIIPILSLVLTRFLRIN